MDPVSATAQPDATATPPPARDHAFSLKDYRSDKPAAPAADVVVADPEIDADPELATAIDELEKPAEQETPQQKAARTKRHKEAAIKSRITKLAKARDGEKERADKAERELTELRARATQAPAASQPAPTGEPAARAAADDPKDPEPAFEQWATKHTFEDYAAKHPNHPDPYAGWTAEFGKDWSRWDRRREQRDADTRQTAATATRARTEAISAFDQHAGDARKEHADFDQKVNDLVLTPPMQSVIFGAGTLGPRIAYALASNPAEYRRIFDLSKDAPAMAFAAMGEFKATVQAGTKTAAPVPPAVTAAPTPHTPVAAGAIGVPPNPASVSGSKLNLRELRQWERAHGRRS